jgi:hypothetical protein
MATKMRKISKCSNFNENWYVGFSHMRNVIVTKAIWKWWVIYV